MSLLEKILKNSTIKTTSTLGESKVFKQQEEVTTPIPAINVAVSGRLDGGFLPGITVFAGPSKHFKTAFALLLGKSYMEKYPDSVMLFYDNEFGAPQQYFDNFGIDTSRVAHTPITNIEELKFDLAKQLNDLTENEKVIVVIDSVGNLASKKEAQNALDENSAADMTRAKEMKSLFRIVTPHIKMKNIPMIVINHTYKEMGLFPKDVVSGGCVVAGTMIQTPEGLKTVEEFKVGDEVITLEGVNTVTHVWDATTLENGEPDCYEIEFEDGHKVVCSDKHKFLIDGKWVEAKDLLVGVEVAVL
jgi:RecA/RadA recombinase